MSRPKIKGDRFLAQHDAAIILRDSGDMGKRVTPGWLMQRYPYRYDEKNLSARLKQIRKGEIPSNAALERS
jgi:hypothetical protein